MPVIISITPHIWVASIHHTSIHPETLIAHDKGGTVVLNRASHPQVRACSRALLFHCCDRPQPRIHPISAPNIYVTISDCRVGVQLKFNSPIEAFGAVPVEIA